MTTTVGFQNYSFDVDYDIVGLHRPASYWDPAEYNEIKINSICIGGEKSDIKELLSGLILDEIEERVMSEAFNQKD